MSFDSPEVMREMNDERYRQNAAEIQFVADYVTAHGSEMRILLGDPRTEMDVIDGTEAVQQPSPEPDDLYKRTVLLLRELDRGATSTAKECHDIRYFEGGYHGEALDEVRLGWATYAPIGVMSVEMAERGEKVPHVLRLTTEGLAVLDARREAMGLPSTTRAKELRQRIIDEIRRQHEEL